MNQSRGPRAIQENLALANLLRQVIDFQAAPKLIRLLDLDQTLVLPLPYKKLSFRLNN